MEALSAAPSSAANFHPPPARRYAPAIRRLKRTVVTASELAAPPAAYPQRSLARNHTGGVMVKHSNYLLISSLAICGILGTAFALSQRADSQEKPLSERVASIERQISDLRARVMRLEKQIFNPAASSGQSVERITTGKTAWRSLQKGMSKDQVRRILGDPEKISMFSTWETWWYPGIGSVEFNDSSRVKGWIEPID